MTGKSGHKKGKHHTSKKGKSRQRSAATTTQQPVATGTLESVSHPKVSAPPATVPTPAAKPTAARYPHIATELRTIGILAGITLIILVVLFLVLA